MGDRPGTWNPAPAALFPSPTLPHSHTPSTNLSLSQTTCSHHNQNPPEFLETPRQNSRNPQGMRRAAVLGGRGRSRHRAPTGMPSGPARGPERSPSPTATLKQTARRGVLPQGWTPNRFWRRSESRLQAKGLTFTPFSPGTLPVLSAYLVGDEEEEKKRKPPAKNKYEGYTN